MPTVRYLVFRLLYALHLDGCLSKYPLIHPLSTYTFSLNPPVNPCIHPFINPTWDLCKYILWAAGHIFTMFFTMFFMTSRTLSFELATIVAGSSNVSRENVILSAQRTEQHGRNLLTTCLQLVAPMGHCSPAISPLPLSPPLLPFGPYTSSALEETFSQM